MRIVARAAAAIINPIFKSEFSSSRPPPDVPLERRRSPLIAFVRTTGLGEQQLPRVAALMSVSLVAVLFLQASASPVSAQAEAACETPPAPVNVGIGSDGLALQISWQRGAAEPTPDAYVVAIARSGIGSRTYYELLHGDDPWVQPHPDYADWWYQPLHHVWMMIDAGSSTEMTFTEHTFINHRGVSVTAALDEGKRYAVHVAARQGDCYSSWTQQAWVTARANGTGRVLAPTDLRYSGNGEIAYTPRSADAVHEVQIVEAQFLAENIEQGTDCLLPWSKVNGNDLTQWYGGDAGWFSNAWDRGTHFFVRIWVYRPGEAYTYSRWILVERGAEPETAPAAPSPPTTPLGP